LYAKLELRAMTKSQGNREIAVMISSTTPSTKYSCSGSPLILAKGSTAIDGLFRQWQCRIGSRGLDRGADFKGSYWLGDVFDLLFADIGEADRKLGPDLVPHNTRDANCSGVGERLQPGCDIDRIAEKIVALHHDVADVDTNSKPHLLTGRSIRNLLGDRVLNRDSTLHGVYRAGEIGDETVARGVEDPTPMSGNQPIDDDPIGRERAKGADLISAHQTAVALDVGGEDRSELPFDGMRFQSSPPP
jgi:hypothetical protein